MSQQLRGEFRILDPITTEQLHKSHYGGWNLEGTILLNTRQIDQYGKLGAPISFRCAVGCWIPHASDHNNIGILGEIFPTAEQCSVTIYLDRRNDGFGLLRIPSRY